MDKNKEEVEAAVAHVLENSIQAPQNGSNTENRPDSKVFFKDWIHELLQKPSVQTEVQGYFDERKERCQTFLSFVENRRQEILESCY